MKQLDEMHSTQELEVMDMFHNVEKTVEKIEDGTTFAERILEHGSGAELLSMKKMIKLQLMSLINNTPKPDVNVRINFHTDQEKFEESITKTFGTFLKVEDEDQKVRQLYELYDVRNMCYRTLTDWNIIDNVIRHIVIRGGVGPLCIKEKITSKLLETTH